MGLVDYSESESSGSEAEAPTKPAPKALSGSKKPFQKVVDRSNPGKIVVSLPQSTATASAASNNDEEPPTKRARREGGGIFSGFNSFLPAPKNANKPTSQSVGGSSSKARPGIHLKTSAAPGFSRGGDDDGTDTITGAGQTSGGLSLPEPKRPAEPSIPEGQKPAEEVKLVGKPLMFKPLSVARNPNKKKKGTLSGKVAATATATTMPTTSDKPHATGSQINQPSTSVQPPKKVSLFSMHTEEPAESTTDTRDASGAYEPLFETHDPTAYTAEDYAQYAAHAQAGPAVSTGPGVNSLDSIADDMNLSATARRELFGREGGTHGVKRVINFNMDTEYQHNEDIRAAGEQQLHNPVRAIHGGKNSLQKLVQNVRGQKEALEESFAKGKSKQREAASRYGW